jgi:hypothetical protein
VLEISREPSEFSAKVFADLIRPITVLAALG